MGYYSFDKYTTSQGRCPSEEFIGSLARKNIHLHAKLQEMCMLLEEFGPIISRKNFPKSFKPQGANIWEIKLWTVRLLFFFKDNLVVLLHGLIKKQDRLPKGELEKAEQEMNDYLGRIK